MADNSVTEPGMKPRGRREGVPENWNLRELEETNGLWPITQHLAIF